MQEANALTGMLDVPVKVGKIRSIYNRYSKIYFLANPLEGIHRLRGIELAAIQPQDKVLEVAVGLGGAFTEILRRIDQANKAYGVDLSPAMVEKTRGRAQRIGYSNFDVREADARHLPFPDESFDVVYSTYMLDLIPLADLAIVLQEFRRVLKRDGRLVLVNFSKQDRSPVFYEKLYRMNPSFWGGCRPVLMESLVHQAGFSCVRREFRKAVLPTEIVSAIKP